MDAEVAKLEQQLDIVEDLVEAGRELLRRKVALSRQETLASELAEETRKLLPMIDGSEPDAPPNGEKKATPASLAMTPWHDPVLKQKRKELGLTQATLATRVGISQVYLGNIETGRCKPSAEILARLRKVLKLPAEA